MTNVKDFFSGNFLKGENCKGGEIVEFLSIGEPEEIKNPDVNAKAKVKIVMNYQVSVDGVEKTFTPNKTNGNILIEAFGEDDVQWVGKKFTISIVKVPMFGKMQNSIVVNPIIAVKPTQPAIANPAKK